MCYRSQGVQTLQQVMKIEKNITIIEKAIYEKSLELSENDIEPVYKNIVYDVVLAIKNGLSLKQTLSTIKEGKVEWQHPEFNDIIFKQQEQDDFIVNPFEVEEGVLTCPKCSKSRTFSYSKQTRSADEPMTTFATCMNCKHKWTYSG